MAMLGEHCIDEQFRVCQVAYAGQKASTMKAAQVANKELERLMQVVDIPEELLDCTKNGAAPNVDMPEDEKELADVKKLLFMNTQVSLAKTILETLLAQDAAWDSRDFLSEPSEDEMKKRIVHYQTASRLLYSMQCAFYEAAALDASFFGPVWKASFDILKTYPKTCLGGVGAVGLLGALAGGGYVSLHIGFRSFLIALFGDASVATGALVGGIAGVVGGAAVIGLIVLYQRKQRSQEQMDAEEVREMKARIAKISERQLSPDDLLELEKLFRNVFHAPLKLARTDICPICHEHFLADGGNNAEYAIKAPRCQGNHVVHQKCLREWQWRSGSDSCIICRQ